MSKEKKPKEPGLMSLASQKRGLLTLSGIVAVIGTLLSFAPCLGIYGIVREILLHMDNLSGLPAPTLMRIAVMVLIATTAGLLCNFAAGLISHKAAFDIVHDLRMRFAAASW